MIGNRFDRTGKVAKNDEAKDKHLWMLAGAGGQGWEVNSTRPPQRLCRGE